MIIGLGLPDAGIMDSKHDSDDEGCSFQPKNNALLLLSERPLPNKEIQRKEVDDVSFLHSTTTTSKRTPRWPFCSCAC